VSAVVVVVSVVVVVVEAVVDSVVVVVVVDVVDVVTTDALTSASLVFLSGFLKSNLEVVSFLAAVVGYRPAIGLTVGVAFVVLKYGRL